VIKLNLKSQDTAKPIEGEMGKMQYVFIKSRVAYEWLFGFFVVSHWQKKNLIFK
jgi:hypothetical protein